MRVSLRAKQKSAAQFRWEPTARRCVASRLGGVSKDPGATCVWRVGHLCREMRVCAMSMSPGLASARPRRARHARGSGGSYTRDTTPSPTTPEAGEGEGQTAASLKCAQDPDSNWKSCWKCACVACCMCMYAACGRAVLESESKDAHCTHCCAGWIFIRGYVRDIYIYMLIERLSLIHI